MKRKGYLFEKVVDEENIRLAIRHAAKGKRGRRIVEKCLANEEETIKNIRNLLVNDKFVPKKPHIKTIYDERRAKTREIACPSFYPDQIIHHAIMQVYIPVFQPSMYYHSYGSIPGKGQHRAKQQAEKCVRRRKGYKYCLQIDVRKFYQSVKPQLVERTLRQKVKDERYISLIMQIVKSYDEGLPIGYYTSQWIANSVLTGLDHFVRELGEFKMIRFADDIFIFGKNKRKLRKLRKFIACWLGVRRLGIKKNWQIFQIGKYRPVSFLGFRIYKERTTIRDKTFLRIRRRIVKMSKHRITVHDARSVMSYLGIFRHVDCEYVLRTYIYPYVNIGQLRRIISYHDYCTRNLLRGAAA